MSELTIRRNRGFAVPQYQPVSKTEKTDGGVQSKKAAGTAGFTISETLRQLMSRVDQAAGHSRESRRTLQTGEAALDEVQDSLERMAKLARASAEGGDGVDRAALQAELEQLREGIDRMIGSATAGDVPLFLDEETGVDGSEALVYGAEAPEGQGGIQALPDWLLKGIAQNKLSAEQVLGTLGLDKNASGKEVLEALARHPLDSSSVSSYLAALYLGAVISGGSSAEGMDLKDAMEGLWQLLEKVEGGLTPDQAIEALTEGEFTSFADFQARFTAGTAPGLQNFLVDLLLSDATPGLTIESSLLALLAGMKGMNLELMMELLTVSETLPASPELNAGDMPSGQVPTQQMGNVQVSGQDLSGVSFDEAAGVLTVGGTADVTIQGTGQGGQAIVITGSGQVTLQNVETSVLTAEGAEVRIFSAGESILQEVRLSEGTVLTLDGDGLLKIDVLHADKTNTLRLIGGAVTVQEQVNGEGETKTLTVPVLVDGPVSLAAQAVQVSDLGGKAQEPFDVIWKALFPGWSAVTSIELDGKQAKMALMNGDPIRLWLTKGDPTHGHPLHSLIIRGRNPSDRPMTRYAYLHWSQNTQSFQEISMYPNPFSVTGGEPGQDWVYEEESQTLHILSSRVTAVSGGSGTDASQAPFSGRIALADGIGPMELSLGGVTCRVSSGRAFSLGQGNEVTLILQSGTSNLFESGTGYAGISLGSGTTLNIECADPHSGGDPDGVLTATGGIGSVSIGWDSEEDWEQPSQILIRGGVSVGAESLTGSVTIIGGIIVSNTGRGSRGEKGLTLQMGEDTVALPQFRLSTRILRLDGLSVATREEAHAAAQTIETGQRWVSRIQAAYGALYNQLEQSFGSLYSQYISMSQGVVRNTDQANTLLEDMRQSILLQSAQAMSSHGKRGTADIGQLLQ